MDEVNIKKIHKHWILLSEDKIPRVDRKINHGGFKGRRGAKIEVQDRRQVDLRVECKNSRGGSSPHLVLACLLASCRDALGLLLLLLFERGGNRFAREPKICRSPERRGGEGMERRKAQFDRSRGVARSRDSDRFEEDVWTSPAVDFHRGDINTPLVNYSHPLKTGLPSISPLCNIILEIRGRKGRSWIAIAFLGLESSRWSQWSEYLYRIYRILFLFFSRVENC